MPDSSLATCATVSLLSETSWHESCTNQPVRLNLRSGRNRQGPLQRQCLVGSAAHKRRSATGALLHRRGV